MCKVTTHPTKRSLVPLQASTTAPATQASWDTSSSLSTHRQAQYHDTSTALPHTSCERPMGTPYLVRDTKPDSPCYPHLSRRSAGTTPPATTHRCASNGPDETITYITPASSAPHTGQLGDTPSSLTVHSTGIAPSHPKTREQHVATETTPTALRQGNHDQPSCSR